MRRLSILLLVLLFCCSCGRWVDLRKSKPLNELDKTVQEENSGVETIEEAEQIVAELRSRLAGAEANLKAMEEAQQRARIRALQSTSYWIAGISMLVVFGCVAALIILAVQGIAVGRKLLIGGAVTGVAVCALALAFVYLIPYLVWIGIGLLGCGILAGIWYFHRVMSLNQEHAKVGVDALYALKQIRDSNGDVAQDVKDKAACDLARIKADARHRQAAKGIYNDIRKIIQHHKKVLEDSS